MCKILRIQVFFLWKSGKTSADWDNLMPSRISGGSGENAVFSTPCGFIWACFSTCPGQDDGIGIWVTMT
jgi:hypothetical protein